MCDDVDIQIFSCSMCDFCAKRKGALKQHMAYKHDVEVKIFSCSMCDCRAKHKGDFEKAHGVLA